MLSSSKNVLIISKESAFLGRKIGLGGLNSDLLSYHSQLYSSVVIQFTHTLHPSQSEQFLQKVECFSSLRHFLEVIVLCILKLVTLVWMLRVCKKHWLRITERKEGI